jgi:hypothetical protein
MAFVTIRTILILAVAVFCSCFSISKSLKEQLAVGTLIHDEEHKTKKTPSVMSASRSNVSFVERAACNLGATYPIPNATTCALFYPARFFAAAATESEFYESSFTGNRQIFESEGNPVISMERNKDAVDNNGVPESITYLHNRKVGGSTMHWAFRKREETDSLGLELHVALAWRMRNEMGIAAYHEAWNRKLQMIVASQQHAMANTNNDATTSMAPAVVFTFVRCPVQRFLSAVGQLLSARHRFQRHFASCLEPKKDQTESVTAASLFDTQIMLKCTLEILEESVQANGPGSFFDVHLEPQAFQMRTGVVDMDVGILILDLAHISNVLSVIRPSSSTIHRRPSTRKEYTGGYDLSAEVLTEELVHQICRIYAMDVQVLQLSSVAPIMCV